MTQRRLHSAFESVANVVIGYIVALLTQLAVFPLFGVSVTMQENLAISLIFTVVSLVRSYALRRIFNRYAGRC